MTPGGYFEGDIEVSPVEDWWIVRHPFTYVTRQGWRIQVPERFCTDFASIPRPLWSLFSPTDKDWIGAALVHDRAYELHEALAADGETRIHLPRSVADDILAEASLCSRFMRRVLWAAVRLGGGGAYETGPARQRERLNALAAMGLD